MRKNYKIKNFEVPILFLIYKNPEITKITFNVIKQIKPKHLFISADGPKKNSDSDKIECLETRKVVENIDWDCIVHTNYFPENKGLKQAVSKGITWFFSHVQEGIILEYDCLPNLDFFPFCQKMLKRYRDNLNIFSISGNNLLGNKIIGDGDYYFSHFFGCWGWATWKRSWDLWTPELRNFEAFKSQNLIENYLNDKKTAEKYIESLCQVHNGINSSTWSFNFEYIQLCTGKLTIVPIKNLVSNIGFGKGATHAKNKNHPLANIQTFNLKKYREPTFIIANKHADTYQINLAYYASISDKFYVGILRVSKKLLPNSFILFLKKFKNG